jgi:hypothetical protein
VITSPGRTAGTANTDLRRSRGIRQGTPLSAISTGLSGRTCTSSLLTSQPPPLPLRLTPALDIPTHKLGFGPFSLEEHDPPARAVHPGGRSCPGRTIGLPNLPFLLVGPRGFSGYRAPGRRHRNVRVSSLS